MKKYIFWLVVFASLEIALALYLTLWREHFWNAVQLKQSHDFLFQLGVFSVIALAICAVAGLSSYVLALTVVKWRENLNEKAFAIRESRIENMNQRQQEDCWKYPDLFISLIFGTGKAIVYILVFSVSLLLSFSWTYLGVLTVYALFGTWVVKRVAAPLIELNYEQQRAEATYRNNLTIDNFRECIYIMLGIAKKQKQLTYAQQFVGQVGVVIPLIIIAPLYFSTGMTLGHLMRFNSLASTILDNMSYGSSNFSTINMFISCRKRLKEASII